MGALLDDLTVLEDNDFVGVSDGTESVSNDHDSLASSFHENVQGFLNLELRFCVESTSGFVKENDLGVADEGSGDGYSLFLASGKTDSLLSYNSVVAFRENFLIFDEVPAVGVLASGLEHVSDGLFRLSFCVNSVHDVVLDGVREQNRLLLHDGNLSLVVPSVVSVFQVNTIVTEASNDGVVPSLNQGNDGGLSATRGSHKSDNVVSRDFQADFVEDGDFFLGGVSKRDIINADLDVFVTNNVSGLFLSNGVNVNRSVDNLRNSNSSSLDLAEVTDFAKHHANVSGQNLHVHEVG